MGLAGRLLPGLIGEWLKVPVLAKDRAMNKSFATLQQASKLMPC